MASVEMSTPMIDDQPNGPADDIPDAPVCFPDPDTSPEEFLAFLKALTIKDLALSWEHLKRRPGRVSPSNLFDEECVDSWTDKIDIYMVSTRFFIILYLNPLTNIYIGSHSSCYAQPP